MEHDAPVNRDCTRSLPPQAAGSTYNQYRIESLLGAGGMGEVYLAEDTRLGRKVALKLLPLAFSTDDSLKARLVREAQAAAILNHPNIMTVYEIGEAGDRLFIALEHVDGQPLSTLDRTAPLTPQEVRDIVIQICEGLSEAHRKGVIHRDIKPSNIIRSTSGRIKIVDFGLASVERSNRLTMTGTRLGTLGYVSPEQIEGRDAGPRSDIFSLGVLAYELLAGKNPFLQQDEAATLYAVLHRQPEPLTVVRPDIPSALSQTIEKMLSKSPSMRHESVNEIISELRGESVPLRSGASTDALRSPSIAVLPFTDMSPLKDQDYFCDGITEEIINALSHVEGLRVVSRTSSFQFRGKELDIRRIGEQLSVSTVLEGSLRKAGERIRVSAQLVSVSDGFHLWSEKYDRAAEDIFAVQDDIAKAIVSTLRDKLLGAGKVSPAEDITRRHSENLQAYHLYLQGRFFWNRRDRQSVIKSLEFFRQAVELDPSYALAYVGLSDAYFMLGAYDFLDPKVAVPAARQAALKALELDESLAEAHTAYAGLLTFFHFEWDRAETEFRRAIQLNSGYSTAYQWYAEMLTFRARYAEAKRNFEIALSLDPLSHIHLTMFGFMYAVVGDLERSSELYLRAIDLGSLNYNLYGWHALNMLQLGRIEAARVHNERARELAGSNPYPQMVDAFIAGRTGSPDQARAIVERLERAAMTEFIPPSYMYLVHFYFGNLSTAYAWLERARETRDLELLFVILPSFTDAVRDARAQGVLKEFGIVWQA